MEPRKMDVSTVGQGIAAVLRQRGLIETAEHVESCLGEPCAVAKILGVLDGAFYDRRLIPKSVYQQLLDALSLAEDDWMRENPGHTMDEFRLC